MRTTRERPDETLSAPLGPAKPAERAWTELDERAARRRIAERIVAPGIVRDDDGRLRTDLPTSPGT